eukprot:COSAG05_NODE_2950_length_2473_cov_60.232098_6_plen_120_part_00
MLHQADKSGEYNLDEEDLKHQVVIVDPAGTQISHIHPRNNTKHREKTEKFHRAQCMFAEVACLWGCVWGMAVRSLLKLLCEPQKGRNKEWQGRMIDRCYEQLDRNDDGDLTRSASSRIC